MPYVFGVLCETVVKIPLCEIPVVGRLLFVQNLNTWVWFEEKN